MLKLILGISGSGKTTLLYRLLRQRAEAGRRSILLVPEQFTSSTEGRIYRELGDELSGFVESRSFTSLAERILQREGGVAIQTLTDAGRMVLVRRALEELKDNVHYYYRHRRSAAFCQLAAETINELKSAGLSGQRLGELAVSCGTESGKLAELAMIFQSYEALLLQTGLDPSDRLTLAAERLEAAAERGEVPDFLQDCAVFIDEFDTFNAPKKRLLAVMLSVLPEMTVALCDDGTPLRAEDIGLFSGAKRVAEDLKRLARQCGTSIASPIVLREDLRHRDSPALAAVAEVAAGGITDWNANTPVPEVRLYAAPNREEEARAVAGQIRRLMRQGVPCSKMAVICRELDSYRAAIRYEFRMANIPLYCDEPTTPEFSAPACAVRALLGLARGMDYTENMTALAKTGLCNLEEAAVCALENYVYTWSPNVAAWHEKFEKSPRGFGETKNLTEEETDSVKRAEIARKLLVEAVDELRGKIQHCTAEGFSHALYICLQKLGAEERQSRQVELLRRVQGIPAAEEAAREWNVVMGLLDQMARLLGQQETNATEYADLFGLLLHASDLGHIPQTLDSVILTTAGKMRLDNPDYLFVLGLAEGEFPTAPGETGLLTHADRDALMAQEVELPDCFENRMVREQVCFYKAMTASAKGLWLSYPKGMGYVESAALKAITDIVQPMPPALTLQDMASTPAAGLDCLGSGWMMNETERASLTAALEEEERRQEEEKKRQKEIEAPKAEEEVQEEEETPTEEEEVSDTEEGERTAETEQEKTDGEDASEAEKETPPKSLLEPEQLLHSMIQSQNGFALTDRVGGSLSMLRRMAEQGERRVNDLSAMRKLLHAGISLSPSQMEQYYSCHYSYFLRYVLGLRPRKKAELSADQSGTLIHWVLQMVLDPNPADNNPCKTAMTAPLVELAEEEIVRLAGVLVDEYANRYLPEDTARFRYLLSRLKKSLAGLLCYLRDEQRQSLFHPTACELKMGWGEESSLPPQEYRLSNGKTVHLIGTVDRVDEWVGEDGTRWLRVMDYKTGSKEFNLRQVYCGLDCQMLFYLFSLTRDRTGRFTGVEPAGVLYLLADPSPSSSGRNEKQELSAYELDGLVQDDHALFTAMDAEWTGKYLPFGFVKGKPSPYQKKKRADAAKLERIERHLDGLITGMGEAIYQGEIDALPLLCGGNSPCTYCDYRFICCHMDGERERTLDAPKAPFESEEEGEEKDNE